MAKAHDWTVVFDADGELKLAFVRGHLDLRQLVDAPDAIYLAAKKIGAEFADIISEWMDGGQFDLGHFWLRPVGDDFVVTDERAEGAFPASGVRLEDG